MGELYVHGLLIGPLVHADLHPGNVLVTQDGDQKWGPGFTLVDWGITCRVPLENRDAVSRLLQASTGMLKCDLRSLFIDELQFTSRDGGRPEDLPEDTWMQLHNLFDPVAQVRGLDLGALLPTMNLVRWPRWVTLWQKATGSLVASLKHLRAEEVPNFSLETSMREVVNATASEVVSRPA